MRLVRGEMASASSPKEQKLPEVALVVPAQGKAISRGTGSDRRSQSRARIEHRADIGRRKITMPSSPAIPTIEERSSLHQT